MDESRMGKKLPFLTQGTVGNGDSGGLGHATPWGSGIGGFRKYVKSKMTYLGASVKM